MTVVHVITGLSNGGAEGALFRLVTANSPHSHHVVSLMDGGVYRTQLEAAGIPVHVLGMPRGRLTLRGVRRLYKLIRDLHPDVVQTWMYHADLLGGTVARLAGCRAVVWGVRASDAHHQGTGWFARVLVRCGAWCSRVLPSQIAFASHAGARVHHAAGYAADRSVIIPNGFDTARLVPDETARARQRRQWLVSDGDRLLGTVARWDSLKDHATLSAALALLGSSGRAWTAVWLGPGMTADNAALVALLDRSGIRDRVRLCGPSTDLAAAMTALDVHVLASRSEAFPNVLAEAMACGTPCVATDVGDAALIVGDTGWVVPSQNAAALAAALETALDAIDDGPAWSRRRQACRDRVIEKFGLTAMVEAYTQTWRRAARGAEA